MLVPLQPVEVASSQNQTSTIASDSDFAPPCDVASDSDSTSDSDSVFNSDSVSDSNSQSDSFYFETSTCLPKCRWLKSSLMETNFIEMSST